LAARVDRQLLGICSKVIGIASKFASGDCSRQIQVKPWNRPPEKYRAIRCVKERLG
jgi:hypothetical protein